MEGGNRERKVKGREGKRQMGEGGEEGGRCKVKGGPQVGRKWEEGEMGMISGQKERRQEEVGAR